MRQYELVEAMLGVRPCEVIDVVVISSRGRTWCGESSARGDEGGEGEAEVHVSYWLPPEETEAGLEPDELEKNSDPESEEVRRSWSVRNARGSVGGNADKKSSGWVFVREAPSVRLGSEVPSKTVWRSLQVCRLSVLCLAKGIISMTKVVSVTSWTGTKLHTGDALGC